MATAELNAEMLRQTRSRAKGPSVTALKNRRRLTEARVIDDDAVQALREAKETQNVEKQPKA